jgi:hypothetical protein
MKEQKKNTERVDDEKESLNYLEQKLKKTKHQKVKANDWKQTECKKKNGKELEENFRRLKSYRRHPPSE